MRTGRHIAELLQGAWSAAPVPATCSDAELAALAPLLLRSGTAALAWRRAALSALRSSPAAVELRKAYQLQTLHAELHAQRIAGAFTALRGAGIDPILGKGWAIARRYPEAGLRPYGDIDLYVAAAAYPRALAALRALDSAGYPIDLHCGFVEVGSAEADVLARAQRLPLGDAEVVVFGDEDHLRLLAVHLLRHGAWRPLWLCDLAVAIAGAGERFDWDYLLTSDRRRANWIAAALALAEELLAAPRRWSARPPPPRWLVPTVLRQWSDASFTPQGARTPMANLVGQPRAMLAALRQRWPNGIEATIGVGGRFDDSPRLPLQLAECVRRAARWLTGPSA